MGGACVLGVIIMCDVFACVSLCVRPANWTNCARSETGQKRQLALNGGCFASKLQNYAKRLGQEAKPNFKQRTGSIRQTAEQK